MNMVLSEISLEFLYLHLIKKFGKNLSKALLKFSIYFSSAIFWTNHDMIGTIPSDMNHWNIGSIR